MLQIKTIDFLMLLVNTCKLAIFYKKCTSRFFNLGKLAINETIKCYKWISLPYVYNLNFVQLLRAPFTHPDYAALVDPLFCCARKRVGDDFFNMSKNLSNRSITEGNRY
jgi:hypothetical protein